MSTEEIKVEDLHPNLVSLAEESKSLKKLKTMADKLVNKVNGRINAERDIIRKKLQLHENQAHQKIDKFVEDTNTSLNAFKKRYNAIYGDLVSRVMVKMEKRIFSSELFEQATLDLCIDKIYRLEKGLKPGEEVDKIGYHAYIEDCAKEHEGFMQKHANEFSKKQKEERDVAIQEEEAKAIKDQDSGGNKDEGSSEANSADSGTTDREDGGPAQSTPSKE